MNDTPKVSAAMSERKVLVVDDEKAIRDLFARALAKEGCTAVTAGSAEEALDLMRQNPAQVLFLDLNLPGLNGLDLCREVRKHWPWSIAIAVTGYASLFELMDCREAGFEDYFLKPLELSALLEAARHAFQKIERWQKR